MLGEWVISMIFIQENVPSNRVLKNHMICHGTKHCQHLRSGVSLLALKFIPESSNGCAMAGVKVTWWPGNFFGVQYQKTPTGHQKPCWLVVVSSSSTAGQTCSWLQNLIWFNFIVMYGLFTRSLFWLVKCRCVDEIGQLGLYDIG